MSIQINITDPTKQQLKLLPELIKQTDPDERVSVCDLADGSIYISIQDSNGGHAYIMDIHGRIHRE